MLYDGKESTRCPEPRIPLSATYDCAKSKSTFNCMLALFSRVSPTAHEWRLDALPF